MVALVLVAVTAAEGEAVYCGVAVGALIVLAAHVKPLLRPASVSLHMAYGVQILLGIATVVSGVALWLAVAHQFVGALLVASFAWCAHVAGRARQA